MEMKDINATVITDLTRDKEEIWKELKKNDRWGINRAKRDCKIEEVNTNKDWEAFYEIYKETLKQGGTDIQPLEDLKKRTKKLFLSKHGGKIIAGLGIEFSDEYDKKIPRIYINASKKEFFNLQANNLLYWYSILWAKEKGHKKLDLGGWQIKARGHLKGINKFKEKFGGVVYFYKDYNFFKAIGRKLVRNVGFFWWLNNKLKRRKNG